MYIFTLMTELGMAFFSLRPLVFLLYYIFALCKYNGTVASTKFCGNQTLSGRLLQLKLTWSICAFIWWKDGSNHYTTCNCIASSGWMCFSQDHSNQSDRLNGTWISRSSWGQIMCILTWWAVELICLIWGSNDSLMVCNTILRWRESDCRTLKQNHLHELRKEPQTLNWSENGVASCRATNSMHCVLTGFLLQCSHLENKRRKALVLKLLYTRVFTANLIGDTMAINIAGKQNRNTSISYTMLKIIRELEMAYILRIVQAWLRLQLIGGSERFFRF